ncbi:SAM-dependent methyltransferase [Clostridium acetobutylicum]|uniref:Predicted SAM dependent methyltransferase n=2 Tax=Clostridium acetobutylicum TaxID=1488 RepID=Q97MP1_CLOAB|nr:MULTISPECIES: SAM-dependent methyltransferase [Clostridium]AAK78135.1 Predicted SAM dependent methyltransferase [Clostridium acetobutylicum ATCC 824]ADZ19195.1 SAM dependent methyltransferase [Clostridium acetobutylicum EA 2018]AEI31085.1 SAM dependent methyltransferase [Clostridium acetobutylicum DSM 1731]AWV81803.1 SAM-dependent methyltransferase [Clostridium acetobutylicum]MBC2395348.1 SAM-dependent methyltransferase [Clostridium acetobutylicum]
MNKKNLSKLTLILSGIKNRFLENEAIFKEITITYTSGLKHFTGKAVYSNDNKLAFNFNGKTDLFTIDSLIEAIINNCVSYDSLELIYSERGTNVLVTADDKNVNIKNINIIEKSSEKDKTSTLLNRNYLIKIGPANDLLKAIDIMTKDNKVKNDKIRKYNQIDHFIELIDSTLDSISRNKHITILDCGCGKSYLTFALNYYLTEVKKVKCSFIGIDISEAVIQKSKSIAQTLGYRNMDFYAMDIHDYKPDRKINMVISLHACDTATDMALALGIRLESDAIIAVPCCHKEMLSQYSYEPFKDILKHGIFKARFADVLTDGMRSLMLEAKGYDVTPVEYISPLETPKNLLIRAIKKTDSNEEAMDSYMKLMADLNVYPALYDFLQTY